MMNDLQFNLLCYFADIGNEPSTSYEIAKGILCKRKSHPTIKDCDTVRAAIKQLIKNGLVVKNEHKYRLSNGTLSYLESKKTKQITNQYVKLKDKFENKVLPEEQYNKQVKELAKTAYELLSLYV